MDQNENINTISPEYDDIQNLNSSCFRAAPHVCFIIKGFSKSYAFLETALEYDQWISSNTDQPEHIKMISSQIPGLDELRDRKPLQPPHMDFLK